MEAKPQMDKEVKNMRLDGSHAYSKLSCSYSDKLHRNKMSPIDTLLYG